MSQVNKNIIIDKKYEGKTFYEISKEFVNDEGLEPLLVNVNGTDKELNHIAKSGDEVHFIYYSTDVGNFAYKKTGIFVMLCAFYRALNVSAELKYMFGDTYFFQIPSIKITDEIYEKVQKEFDRIVEEDIVIKKHVLPRKTAMQIIEKREMKDVDLLFKYIYKPEIKFREIDGFFKYIYGEILYSTGQLKNYIVKKFENSILLIFPSFNDFSYINEFDIPKNLVGEINEYIDWENKTKINTIGKYNSFIANNDYKSLIIMSESLHDKNLGIIADDIVSHKNKLVCISGPSCSGKTSFSHRLSYHLLALGIDSFPLAADNFFVDRGETPRTKDGELDFECLEAIDIKLLNDVLNKLLNGEEVIIPKFDFINGKKIFDEKNKVKLKDNQIVILEGIHCLNPKLIPSLKEEDKYTIFVAPLNKYAMDNANPISSNDIRLLRRISRDSKTRGYSAKETILRWDKVIEGDNNNIYPCIKYVKSIFNTSTLYELNVMKVSIMPQLYCINDDEEVGYTARRLIKILNYVLPESAENIPNYAIAREFIGGSVLDVG